MIASAGCGAEDGGGLDSHLQKLDGTESHEFEQEDIDAATGASDAVKDYSADSVSEAQRLGCESHVTEDEIHDPRHPALPLSLTAPTRSAGWGERPISFRREQVRSACGVPMAMDTGNPRPNTRRFRRFLPGDELNLCLRPELTRELGPVAAARIQELQTHGVDRLPVHVVKAPQVIPGADDTVEVEAPDLVGPLDPTISVRVEFLELPITAPRSKTQRWS